MGIRAPARIYMMRGGARHGGGASHSRPRLRMKSPHEQDPPRPFRSACHALKSVWYAVWYAEPHKVARTEAWNAWTHLLFAVALPLYTVVRASVWKTTTVSHLLSVAASGVAGVMFSVSTAFHTYHWVRDWGNWMRTVDISAIYVAVSLATLADLSLATRDFELAPEERSEREVLLAERQQLGIGRCGDEARVTAKERTDQLHAQHVACCTVLR